ncbi:hypothetical protein BPTFM16_01235 [Altererythrobacter insulae]|nr:hypothetical protein BPTFM16_01235 [Altererythrobacter insulae]
MNPDLEREIARLLENYSISDVRQSVNKFVHSQRKRELTVVVNFGMHALPEDLLKGDTFFFSEGNVDLDAENVDETISLLTKRATRFLRGKVWTDVYLIPSGHPLLVVLATLIVYRVTRVNPTIVYYMNGEYFEAKLDVRRDAVGVNTLR